MQWWRSSGSQCCVACLSKWKKLTAVNTKDCIINCCIKLKTTKRASTTFYWEIFVSLSGRGTTAVIKLFWMHSLKVSLPCSDHSHCREGALTSTCGGKAYFIFWVFRDRACFRLPQMREITFFSLSFSPNPAMQISPPCQKISSPVVFPSKFLQDSVYS